MSSGQSNDQLQLIQMLVQYVELQRRLSPVIPGASQKLVKDLVDDGCDVKRLSKVVGRSPSYVRGVYNGQKQLNAQELLALVRHAAAAFGGNNASE